MDGKNNFKLQKDPHFGRLAAPATPNHHHHQRLSRETNSNPTHLTSHSCQTSPSHGLFRTQGVLLVHSRLSRVRSQSRISRKNWSPTPMSLMPSASCACFLEGVQCDWGCPQEGGRHRIIRPPAFVLHLPEDDLGFFLVTVPCSIPWAMPVWPRPSTRWTTSNRSSCSVVLDLSEVFWFLSINV